MRILLCLLLLLTGSLIGHASAQDRETVVFLAPKGPFFIGINMTVDGKDFREWLTGYLFDRMDSDRDKKLGKDELGLMPPQLLTRLGFADVETLATSVLNDQEKVSRDDFIKFLKSRLSASFLISEQQQSAAQAINILPKFDADKDGHLSEQELQNALNHQAQQDIDDDEALSAAELLPFRDPAQRFAAVAPNTDDLPFVQLVTGSEERLAKKLVKYYSTNQKDSKLTAAGTRLEEENFKAFDADSSGHWDVAEATQFLKKPQHHVTLDMQFSRRRKAKLKSEVLVKDDSVIVKSTGKSGRLELVLGKLPLAIKIDQSLNSNSLFTRRFVGQRFSVQDKDKNKYLDKEEFPEFVGQVGGSVGPLMFEALDVNDDEMVTREELYRHLDRDTLAAQSQLAATVQSDGRSMFQMLDTNKDRRLSLRELKNGFANIEKLDQDDDRRVSRMEASSPSQYTLEVGFGRPALFRDRLGMDNMMMQTGAIVRSTDVLEGPLWFRKMDRNRDGDVSKREFLGSSAQFNSLDTDKDGLLDAKEAEAAKAPN